MNEILEKIETPYVDAQTLLSYLREYHNPRDYISRMVKKGLLLRLRNGFFLIPSRFSKGDKDYPYEQLANLIYGPSYVSLEWALSFYNFIPERVAVVTSVTTGSRKDYSTHIGSFAYKHLSQARYSVGIKHLELTGQIGGFLIATPEKALADWVFLTSKNLSQDELLVDLLESKRIEKDRLQSLRKGMMETIAKQYRSKTVNHLHELIKQL